MAQTIKHCLKKILASVNVGITSHDNLRQLTEFARDVERLFAMPDEGLAQLTNLMDKSRSQIRQDLFVLSELQFKTGGYFVEFGATNGVSLSNTYLLEKEFGWNGILAEPAKSWHTDLRRNRSCHIETKCIWEKSHQTLSFNEVNEREYSTIDSYTSSDAHRHLRKNGLTYDVDTLSLTDLLKKYQAPATIDYLSIDTDGSEFDILRAFDFASYEFLVITCEHNFTPMRERIHALLTAHGYRRKFFALSRFDDWYVRA
jgi:FkbM family methyltransferase